MPCSWESPDGTRGVILDCNVVAALKSHAIKAFLSLPRRGVEVGGLLLGHVDRNNRNLVWVESFKEVSCEHRYGPSFVLSDGDRDRLRRMLAQTRGEPGVVGLFRSYTGREPVLDPADEDLIRAYFRNRNHAFLLIQPISTDRCLASFAFWENGELPTEPRYPQFAFEPEQMAAAEVPHPAVAEASAAESEPEPVPAEPAAVEPPPPVACEEMPQAAAAPEEPAPEGQEPEPPPPALVLPEPRWRHYDEQEEEKKPAQHAPRRRFWLPVMAVTGALLAAAFAYELWMLANQPRSTPLALDARSSAGQVELAWDAGVPAVRKASRGILSVTDGPVRQDIRLDAAEIRAGRYPYKTTHSDVLFRLDLFDGRFHSSSGSLRLLALAPEPAPVKAAEPPQPQAATAAPAKEPAATPTATADRVESLPVTVPPVVLHEVHPTVPAGIRSRIRDRVVVPVEVRIAASGRVTSAVSQGGGDSIYRYLANRAARAAYSWRFQPARSRNGKRVPSSRIVYFVFTRS